MLTRYDELPHPQVADEEFWRESWYLNFFDHEKEIYGIAWMGVRPNKQHGEILFAIGQGERFLFKHEDFAIPIPQDIGGDRTHFGPLSFRVVEPFQRWQVVFDDGASKVELEWEAICPVNNWTGYQAAFNSWHWQHPGRVTGTIDIGTGVIPFSGLGERDRAYGCRNDRSFTNLHWITAQWPDGLAFHTMQMTADDGEHLYGFVQDDGVASLISRLELDVTYAYKGGAPIAVDVFARDRMDREFRFHQELMNTVTLGHASGGTESRQYFTFNRVWNGDKLGYGMLDHWWSDLGVLRDRYVLDEPNRSELLPLELFSDAVALPTA